MADYLRSSGRQAPLTSNRFMAAAPPERNFGDYFAEDFGRNLGRLGLAMFDEPKVDANALKIGADLEDRERKQIARERIGYRLKQLGKENALDLYFEALEEGAHAGLDQKEIDGLFRGAAASRGAGSDVLGRIGDRGTLKAGDRFAPEDVTAYEDQQRGFSLADEAAKIAETQRQEAVKGGAATLAHTREQENIRLREDLRASRAPAQRAPMGANETLALREMVNTALADRVGLLPTKEGDLPLATDDAPGVDTLDAGLVSEITTRAAQLMASENVPAAQAVTQAIGELANVQTGVDAEKPSSIFGFEFGGSPGKTKITKQGGRRKFNPATGKIE